MVVVYKDGILAEQTEKERTFKLDQLPHSLFATPQKCLKQQHKWGEKCLLIQYEHKIQRWVPSPCAVAVANL